MWRGLSMSPVTGRDADPSDPVNRPAAIGAVEDELFEFPLDRGFRLEELEPKHLRVDGERMGSAEARGDRLVDERACDACSFRIRTARSRMSRSCR